jgi:hypothetical protein
MVRFIFVCMTIVALTLVSMPVRGIYDGIQDQRDATLAQNETAQAEQLTAAATTNTDDDTFGFDVAAEPSADDLNAIATAAGDFGDVVEDTGFGPSFSGTAPAALSGPVEAPPAQSPAQ